MKIYCISDIHAAKNALLEALDLISDDLDKDDTKLIFLGDYVHGGYDNDVRGVLDIIINLQEKHGSDKVIALMGNHECMVNEGVSTLDTMKYAYDDNEQPGDNKYINWISHLPLYHKEGNTIFVHAGIDEEAGESWEWGTSEEIFVEKFPAEVGQVDGLDMKIVAGHVYTSQISGNPHFNEIYYDGASHYYIDGDVMTNGELNILLVDTDTDEYFRVTESGNVLIESYSDDY